jgi:membrane dipeptidase
MSDTQPQDVCIDGLCLDFRGWTDDLAASGLSAVHASTTVVWDVAAGYTGYTSALEAITLDTMQVKRFLRDSSDHMFQVDSPADLDRLGKDGKVGLILGLQDLTGLEYHPHLAEALRELGIRVVQPVYNYANHFADGHMEQRDAGLSNLGRRMVKELNDVGISLDVSHVGERSSLEIVELSSLPVSVTHANRRAVYDNARNKSDDVLRAVADSGGAVGVVALGAAIWNEDPSHFPTMQDVVDHIAHLVDFLGEDAVAIGTDHMLSQDSDNDPVPGWWRGLPFQALARKPASFGAYREAFHPNFPAEPFTVGDNWPRGFETVAQWADLPQLVRDAGLSEEAARKVLGQNWIRFFRDTWVA